MFDVTTALRSLRRAPGYVALVAMGLAIAIGAATAAASVVYAALLRPLPHIDVDRWANLYERPVNEGLGGMLSVSIPNYRDWKQQSTVFADMVLWMPWSFNVTGDDRAPERLPAAIVTPNLFTALRLSPAAGRLLQPSDDPVNGRVALISHDLWERRFASDHRIIGGTIRLNHVAHTVVGVAPPDFTFPAGSPVDVWLPESAQTIAADRNRDARGGHLVSAMLRPGATWDEARAEMNAIAARLANAFPENKGFGVAVVPLRESLAGDIRRPLLTLLGALLLIVLLVCVNVSNLQLVRLESRRQEFAVRAALGASRGQLVRQAVFESALIALAAAALGLAIAPIGVRALLSFVPADALPWLRVSTDMRALLVAAGCAGLVTLIAGVAPALRGIGADLSSTLARGPRGWTAAPIGRRLRQGAVVVQLALSLVLVVSAALLIQTFLRLQRVDPGFSAAHRMTLSYYAPRARYPDAGPLVALIDRVREQVGQAPGVRAVGLAQALPFAQGVVWMQALTREDPRSVANLAQLPHVHYNVVSAGYAEALGVPLRRGRAFDDTDTATSPPVVVINEALARRFFPNQDPIGQQLWVGHAQALPELPRRTVVGVVGDARWSGLDDPAGPEAWVPFAQQSMGVDILRTAYVVFHTTSPTDAVMPVVRARMRDVDPDLPLTSVRTLESRLGESVWRQRLAAGALGVLGVAALAVALVGVFAVASYVVGRRTHEMGVRLALGARPRALLRLVLAEHGRLVAVGVLLGGIGAFAGTRLLSSLLFGVEASDPFTFIGAAIALASAAMLACYVPAFRASRVDPLVALRGA